MVASDRESADMHDVKRARDIVAGAYLRVEQARMILERIGPTFAYHLSVVAEVDVLDECQEKLNGVQMELESIAE